MWRIKIRRVLQWLTTQALGERLPTVVPVLAGMCILTYQLGTSIKIFSIWTLGKDYEYSNVLQIDIQFHISLYNKPPSWKTGGILYAYSSIVGGKLCLLVGVRTVSFLRSRHNIPSTPTPHDLHRFGSWWILSRALGKAHGGGTFSNCGAGLGYHLVLGPLFWECPHPRALPYTLIEPASQK
jgi:hypothetical protein